MKTLLLCMLVFVSGGLRAAEKSPHPKSVQVVAALKKAGVKVGDVKPGVRREGTPLPNTYVENVSFSLPSIRPKGGQLFVFTQKTYAEAVVAYFARYRDLAPYVYKSKDGLVVVQLNSGLNVAKAEEIERVLAGFSLAPDTP